MNTQLLQKMNTKETLPAIIYQFRRNDTSTLSNLVNSQLFFNDPENFNDPYECTGFYKTPSSEKNGIEEWVKVNFKNKLDKESYKKKLEYYFEHPSEIDKVLNEQVNKLIKSGNAVSCFTIPGNIKNTLMWSHYANNHYGVCFGFSSSMKLVHITEGHNGTHIFSPTFNYVFYSDQKFHNRFSENAPKPLDLMHQKSECWKYENEIRGISPKKGLHFLTDSNDLIEIILGVRTPKSFANEIIDCLNSFDYYKHVKLKKMYMKKDNFKLYSKEIRRKK